MYNIITTPCSELRAQARKLLKGKWKKIVLATLVYMLLASGPSLLGHYFDNTAYVRGFVGFVGIITFVIGGPMMLGFTGLCLKVKRGEEFEIADIFDGFRNFGSAFVLQLLIFVFVFLWTLLFFIPGIIATIRYSQAFLILYDNPSIKPIDAIRESKKIMKGNKGKYFLLCLSFIGWAILCGFTLGIGSLWLSPYFYVTMAVFYDEIVGNDFTDGTNNQQNNEASTKKKGYKYGFYE